MRKVLMDDENDQGRIAEQDGKERGLVEEGEEGQNPAALLAHYGQSLEEWKA